MIFLADIKEKKMRKFGFKFFSTNFQTAPETITECAEFALSKEDIFMEFTAVTVTTNEEFKKIIKDAYKACVKRAYELS